MKFSEAVEIIKESAEHQISTKTAEKILNNLELNGMLPPLNNWEFHMDGDHADISNTKYRTWEMD